MRIVIEHGVHKYQKLVWDFQMYLRNIWKYRELTDGQTELIDDIWHSWLVFKNENGIEDEV